MLSFTTATGSKWNQTIAKSSCFAEVSICFLKIFCLTTVVILNTNSPLLSLSYGQKGHLPRDLHERGALIYFFFLGVYSETNRRPFEICVWHASMFKTRPFMFNRLYWLVVFSSVFRGGMWLCPPLGTSENIF